MAGPSFFNYTFSTSLYNLSEIWYTIIVLFKREREEIVQLAWILLNDANGMELASSHAHLYMALSEFMNSVKDQSIKSRIGIVAHLMKSGDVLIEIAHKMDSIDCEWSGIPFYLYDEIRKGMDGSWIMGGTVRLPDGRGAFRTSRNLLAKWVGVSHISENSLERIPISRFLGDHGTWLCFAAYHPSSRLAFEDCSNVEFAIWHYDPIINERCAKYAKVIERYRTNLKSTRQIMEDLEADMVRDAERAADALNLLSDKYGIEIDVDGGDAWERWDYSKVECPEGFVSADANYYPSQNSYLGSLAVVVYEKVGVPGRSAKYEVYWIDSGHETVKRVEADVLDRLGILHDGGENGRAFFNSRDGVKRVVNDAAEISAAMTWGGRIKDRKSATEVAMCLADVAAFKANEDGVGHKSHDMRRAKKRIEQNMTVLHAIEAEMRKAIELHETTKATLMKTGLIDE